MVLGIIFYAVAAKKTLEHPLEPLSEPGRWALGLGIAFFLSGFVLARYRVYRRIAWERVAAGATAVVAAVLLDGTDAIVTLAVVLAILVAAIAVETARLREIRALVRAS
jgi:low temperature requirement protein LtrA